MAEINILQSSLYQKDLEKTVNSSNAILQLRNKSVLITGCNGLICSALCDVLLKANEILNLNISVFLATRNIGKTKNRFDSFNQQNIHYVEYDATKPFSINDKIDFFIHGASNASPNLFISAPVETMQGNIFGLQEILNAAVKTNSRVLYISSSEVYGNIQTTESIKETDSGYLELLNAHSSYGISKRAAETLCSAYETEYNINFVIARPGHIYGPTASTSDIRVASQFMYKAASNENLVLKSEGKQLRSYCYCLDCASALISILVYGNKGNAYNISNPSSIITIAEMTSLFAKYSDVKVEFQLPKDLEQKAFNTMSNSSLNSTKLESLGWKNIFSKEEGFEHSIQIIKELLK